MKILSIAIVLSIAGFMRLPAQAANGRANIPEPTAYAVTTRDENSQVWQRTTYEAGPDGKAIPRIHKYTELATGLNHLMNGQWVASDETITILPDGTAAATNGQHQAYFPSDIYNGEIKLVTPDGKVLLSQPTALSYDDGSNTVLIAVLTNSIGQLMSSNQIVYPNAFVGLNADLRYTYTKAGFEQDVILHEQPPAPASLGLNPDTTKIQVMTEFFNPPAPAISTSVMQTVAGEQENEQLTFGAMRMMQGKAFSLGTNAPPVLVNKQWLQMGGRQFLVEEVPTAAMADDLESLPPPVNQTRIISSLRVASGHLILPAQHLAGTVRHHQPIQLADTALPPQGLVLDYLAVNNSMTNITFQGDTTYYISSGFIDYQGSLVFEGGAVIKFGSGGGLSAPGEVNILASEFRPVIFTAKDDNSLGETISGSTGVPSGYYANPALQIPNNTNSNFSHFRISYAQVALLSSDTDPRVITVSDAQFVNCAVGVEYPHLFSLENVLFVNVMTNISDAYNGAINAQNVTFNNSSYLATTITVGGGRVLPGAFNLTNCVLAGITNISSTNIFVVAGNYNGFFNCQTFGSALTTNTFYPFQTVGGGSYYLTNGCYFHNAGTTNIDPTLLNDLAYKTTYPPIAYTNLTFSTVQTFPPQAQRDNIGNPDLGYHYDPLDYTFGGCTITTNVTFSAGTAVGWFRTTSGWTHAGQGIQLSGNINVAFNGTATSPDYWVRLNTVQENDQTAGYGHGSFESWASPPVPTVTGYFLHCTVMAGEVFNSYFADDYGTIQANMTHSEFWSGSLLPYGDYMNYTNCLLWRVGVGVNNGESTAVLTMRNCTMIGGSFSMNRNDSYGLGALPVSVRDCAFDGTLISTADTYGSNPSVTDYNYNAYTNSTDPFSLGGANDVMVTNGFNWQSSWFGNYYQTTNSQLINVGSTSANLVGLYYFTTQTNQVIEGTSQVDIGYHYVATDPDGNPLNWDADGIPNYLEDTDPNNPTAGILNVFIDSPANGAVLQ